MECSKCKQEKSEDEFDWRVKGQTKRKQCKACVKECSSTHYSGNKEGVKRRTYARNKRVWAENTEKYAEYLRNHPCVDCGEGDIVVLDPDHRKDKTADVSLLLKRGCCWDRILSELAKCEIRCANCHRRRTAKEQGWRKALGA